MSPIFDWFSRRSGATHTPDSSTAEKLELARALAREGKQQEASDAYWKIKAKHRTVESLLEHADVLFALGDYFRAASMASDVLEREPDNAQAKAVQTRIRKAEDAERRR